MKLFKNIIYIGFACGVFFITACNKDVLDRPELGKVIDSDFWNRLFFFKYSAHKGREEILSFSDIVPVGRW